MGWCIIRHTPDRVLPCKQKLIVVNRPLKYIYKIEQPTYRVIFFAASLLYRLVWYWLPVYTELSRTRETHVLFLLLQLRRPTFIDRLFDSCEHLSSDQQLSKRLRQFVFRIFHNLLKRILANVRDNTITVFYQSRSVAFKPITFRLHLHRHRGRFLFQTRRNDIATVDLLFVHLQNNPECLHYKNS